MVAQFVDTFWRSAVEQIVKKQHAPSVAAGRSAAFKRGGSWCDIRVWSSSECNIIGWIFTYRAIKAKNGGKWPVHAKKAVEEKPAKTPRFYPAEDIPKPFDR
jgi:hypothetical protein